MKCLSRNTVADRICEMATDVKTWLIEKGKDFVAYSIAVDLAIFIRGVDSTFNVTEETLYIKSMHRTTGKDIFDTVCQSVTDMNLFWTNLLDRQQFEY
ncbi:unnamed protein product [Dicrocoelium dendriticum]|nr:unnamed protein product [Dicrocoelium dendriticum]